MSQMSGLASRAAGLLRGPIAARAQPDMAMAGGTDASNLPQALASVRAWVAERA